MRMSQVLNKPQLDLNEMSKPLCIDLSGKDFDWLIKDVNDNLDNKNYKTKVGNIDYNLKNAKKGLSKIGGTKKISKSEALKLHNDLIKPDVDVLTNGKGRGKNKRAIF